MYRQRLNERVVLGGLGVRIWFTSPFFSLTKQGGYISVLKCQDERNGSECVLRLWRLEVGHVVERVERGVMRYDVLKEKSENKAW